MCGFRKSLYVEKKDIKLTKNQLFGYRSLTNWRKSFVSTKNEKISKTKFRVPEIKLKIACDDVLILHPPPPTLMIDTIEK